MQKKTINIPGGGVNGIEVILSHGSHYPWTGHSLAQVQHVKCPTMI